MQPSTQGMNVQRYVLVAVMVALIPFLLLKTFWPMASSSHKQPTASLGVEPVNNATASATAMLPTDFAAILAYLNQHKTLARMTDARELSLPDIAKHGYNQIRFTYTDQQLNDFHYADGNNTASYVSRQFQDIVCNSYPAEIRQIFIQKYISFRLILQNRNQFTVLSESFNPQQCPASQTQN